MVEYTEQELIFISDGILQLINNAVKAKELVVDPVVQCGIDYYIKTLQKLNSKICSKTNVADVANKKYVMIVTSEDERYGNNGIGLGFFSDHPWEGRLENIVYGDDFKELFGDGKYEGLFYQLYSLETGDRIGYGNLDPDSPVEEIEEWEKNRH